MKKNIVMALIIATSCYARKEQVALDSLYAPSSPISLGTTNFNGRGYYDALVEKASRRHWAIVPTIQYATATGGFNCNGCSSSLFSTVSGSDCITIRDIYLFSRLSDDNKVRINNGDARDCQRCTTPIGSKGVPFGGYRDDLYTTLLAPVQLQFDASESERSFILAGMYRFDVGSFDCLSIVFEATVPFKSQKHTLNLTYKNGELFRPGYIPDTTQRENTLTQFFREYSSVEDFIESAIFAPKSLAFLPTQTKNGIGDISVYGLIEYHNDWSFEVGLQAVFPTGSKGDGNALWEPILGNGGAFQFDPFAQLLITTAVPYFNPFARVAAELSVSYHTDSLRVPTLVTNPARTQVQYVQGLSAPESFQGFYVDEFSEYDTCVPLFANKTPCIERKIGTKLIAGIGNYAYKLFNVDFRWGIFYDFYHKSKDSISNEQDNCDCDQTVIIDACAMERCTNQTAHILGTNLTYKFSNLFELGAGGQYTFLGTNVPKTGLFYLSFVAVF